MRRPNHPRSPSTILACYVLAVAAFGCSTNTDEPTSAPAAAPLALSSLNLSEGGAFQTVNTCAGDNVSPQLSWTGGPAETLTYALTLTDLTAGTTQWALWNVTASVRSLPAGLSRDPLLPNNPNLAVPTSALQSESAGAFGYQGPCPMGATHTFQLRIDALGTASLPGLAAGSDPGAVAAAASSASLGHAEINASSNASPSP